MSRHKSLVLVAGVVVIAGGIWFGNTLFFTDSGSSPQGTPPPGKVWSPEHGHYHDASPGQLLPGSGQAATPEPPGATPPGKVWSPEHGHYHDAPVGQLLADSAQTDTP